MLTIMGPEGAFWDALQGNRHTRHTFKVGDLDSTGYDDDEEREETVVDANLVGSLVDTDSWLHEPLLDIDRCVLGEMVVISKVMSAFSRAGTTVTYDQVQCVTSSTVGNFHVYVQREVPQSVYWRAMMILVAEDVMESGYVAASIRRGQAFLRLPWIKKAPEAWSS